MHFTQEQLTRMMDEQLDRVEAAYTEIVTLEQEGKTAKAPRVSFRDRTVDSIS